MAIKHAKVLTTPDGADASVVRPSDWNAPLVIDPGTITDTHVAAANKDGAANVVSMRTLGTASTQACAGDDPRLSDARSPTAHNHDASYAAIGHAHAGVYAPVPTGVLSDCQISLLQAPHTLVAQAAAQAVFPAAQDAFTVSGVAAKVLNAASTAARTMIEFDGILVTVTGGTITPQVAFSVNPTGTNQTLRGSYVCLERLGADTATKIGGWA